MRAPGRRRTLARVLERAVLGPLMGLAALLVERRLKRALAAASADEVRDQGRG